MEFDPHAAFIAEDKLEYLNLADYICSKPVDSWRNRRIQGIREECRGSTTPEERERRVDEYIAFHDGGS